MYIYIYIYYIDKELILLKVYLNYPSYSILPLGRN